MSMREFEKRRGERGLVSLLTVIFFMIFVSLIVVGFITIVVQDQRQAIDDGLSANALAAAHGGVEDAKRILLYCRQNPTSPNCTNSVLNSQNNCNLFATGGPGRGVAGELGMNLNDNGEGTTGALSSENYQQYFTCLTIQTDTPSLTQPLNATADYVQHLRTEAPFSKLQVSWSDTGATYAPRGGSLGGWLTYLNWSHAPVLQLQVIPYTPPLNDLNSIESDTRTVYIVPCTGSTCSALSSNDINVLDIRAGTDTLRATNTLPPIAYAQCTLAAGTYDCSAILEGFNGGGGNPTQYYVRVSLLYASRTILKLASLDAANSPVLFDNVQPWIDVTGRANDVFKRVHAEVSYAQPIVLPRHALDSAAPICKDMTVTNVASSSTYNCP